MEPASSHHSDLPGSPEDWIRAEVKEHDERYSDSGWYPSGGSSPCFTVDQVWAFQDYAFKGPHVRTRRGDRTRRFLEAVDLDSLAGKKVLDIGSGKGDYCVLYAKCGADVVGVELSHVGVDISNMLAKENGVADRCKFIRGDFNQSPLDPGSFDLVLLHEVLHHIIKYPGFIEKLEEVVKRPGGRIVAADSVRGAGLIQLGRRAAKAIRHWRVPGSFEADQAAGDVQIRRSEVLDFGRRLGFTKIEQRHFFYMIKETPLGRCMDWWAARALLRTCKAADDVLLTVCPWMRRFCPEFVMTVET